MGGDIRKPNTQLLQQPVPARNASQPCRTAFAWRQEAALSPMRWLQECHILTAITTHSLHRESSFDAYLSMLLATG
jgi:hypothetical protein